jgi:putative intracellular protease/amidase
VVRPGFEMDEFAQAWLVLRANGVQVDVASPAGGAVVADRYSRQDDTLQAMERDPDALAALAATRRLQDAPVGEHAAVFVMGGKGAMFDLPRDAALARLLAALHFKHPRLRLSLAKAHAALGAPQRSRELLQRVAGSDHSDAKARSEALELLARQPG